MFNLKMQTDCKHTQSVCTNEHNSAALCPFELEDSTQLVPLGLNANIKSKVANAYANMHLL